MTTDTTPVLPVEFADLEPFSAWSIKGDHERYQRRLASTIEEMETFYRATVPRVPDALEYLNQFDLEDMPDSAYRLLWLLFSVSTVSFAVDVFKQPKIPDSGSAYIEFVREPSP